MRAKFRSVVPHIPHTHTRTHAKTHRHQGRCLDTKKKRTIPFRCGGRPRLGGWILRDGQEARDRERTEKLYGMETSMLGGEGDRTIYVDLGEGQPERDKVQGQHGRTTNLYWLWEGGEARSERKNESPLGGPQCSLYLYGSELACSAGWFRRLYARNCKYPPQARRLLGLRREVATPAHHHVDQ